MLIAFTEADYAGASRYYDGSAAALDEMRIGSYMVRLDPIVSACGGDRSVKVVFWDRKNFTSSSGAQPYCFSRDQRDVEDVVDAAFVKMRSVHVNRAYKLIAFRQTNYAGDVRVLFSDDADTAVGLNAFKVKSYLLVPSVALESVEETDAGVVLSYSRVSTGSHSVVIPRAAFRVVESEDELSRTLQYATGREDEPWRDLATVKDGRDGEDGKDGAGGAQGPQGDKGDAGPPGQDGAVGAQGPQGAAGPPGQDGKDGTSQVASFDPLTSSCGDDNKGVMEYDRAGTNLLICDGAKWITLSFTQTGTRLDFPSADELGSATSFGGWGHTCAVLDNGNVECWGRNTDGQTNVPAGLAGRVRQIAAGQKYTCAVTDDGNAECWGLNRNGRTNVPTGLAGRVHRIAAGGHHTCAVTDDGNVECWGWNGDGQTNVPAGLAGRVRRIAAGVRHTCAGAGRRQCRVLGS